MTEFKTTLIGLISSYFKLSVLLTLIFLIPNTAFPQIRFTGFYRNYNAIQTLPDHQLLIGRNRIRIDMNHELLSGEILISNDIRNLYSASSDSFDYRLREAYIDLYFSNSDLRLGKQIIVWGRTEGAFIIDILSPVDLSEFLTQDFSDLRSGITALSYLRYIGSNFLQFVLNPVFTPNTIPEPSSRWFPGATIGTEIPTRYREYSPNHTLDNMQWAGRWGFRSNLNMDLDLGILYWHHPSPRYYKELAVSSDQSVLLELTEAYNQTMVAMYSGSYRLSDKLLLTSESSFYLHRNFDYLNELLQNIDFDNPSEEEQRLLFQSFARNDDGFLKKRPWLISMIGLRYELLDWAVSGQLINEHIFNHDSTILQEKNYNYVTLSLNRSFKRDTYSVRGFARYNFRGKDFWINPEITYAGIDAFEVSLGGQLFGGTVPKQNFGHLSFNQYASNSFVYLKATAFF